jgi:hypothetical protein
MPSQPNDDSSGSPWMLLLTLLLVLTVVGLVALKTRSDRRKYGGPPKFVGPPLAGTARILLVSLERLPSSFAKNPPIRQILLNVKIPGHEPYEAATKQEVPVEILKRIRFYGGTVAVQVDSANLSYVRIDFSQPVT